MSDQQPIRIDVVSDVVCPWCFIGKHRLEKALALRPGVAAEVHWRRFFLNDWIPYKGIAPRVTAAAAEEGLVYASDKVKRQPNTLDCHRLIRWAERIGKAAEMKQKLMDLYFTQGADLTDCETLGKA